MADDIKKDANGVVVDVSSSSASTINNNSSKDVVDTGNKMEVDEDNVQKIMSSTCSLLALASASLEPENAFFLSSLSQPIREIFTSALTPVVAALDETKVKSEEGAKVKSEKGKEDVKEGEKTDDEKKKVKEEKEEKTKLEAAARSDKLEIQLRDELLKRIHNIVIDESPAAVATKTEVELSEVLEKTPSMKSLVEFWIDLVLVVQHILHFQTQNTATNTEENSTSSYDYSLLASNLVRKLPILLLEDVLDILSVEQAVVFWHGSVKVSFDVLFGDLLWHEQHAAWLPFLKVANKFWRRLTSFAFSSSSSSLVSLAAADVMWTLAAVYPLSEKSATRVWGSHNTDNETTVETETEFQEETKDDDDDDNDNETNAQRNNTNNNAMDRNMTGSATTKTATAAATDYTFYQTFWKLQHDFRNPNGVAVADFLQRLKTVLQALESHPLVIATPPSSETNTKTTNVLLPLYLPYLTHSRILHIQLKDPALRIQILTQFLLVAHHLVSQVRSLETQLSSLQNTTAKLIQQAADLITTTTTTTTTMTTGAKTKNAKSQSHFLDVLNSILQHSETQWRQWKQKRCSPASILENRAKPKVQNITTRDRKRRRGAHHNTTTNATDESYRLLEPNELKEISRSLRDAVPSYDHHLEEYVDALDPEAGIDDEYHPKNNPNFCWQALRLLSSEMLPNFGLVHPSGDFECLVRHVYKNEKETDIPGPGPEPYVWDENDDDDEEDEGEDAVDHNEPEKEEESHHDDHEDQEETHSDLRDDHESDEENNEKEDIMDVDHSEGKDPGENESQPEKIVEDTEQQNDAKETPMDVEKDAHGDVKKDDEIPENKETGEKEVSDKEEGEAEEPGEESGHGAGTEQEENGSRKSSQNHDESRGSSRERQRSMTPEKIQTRRSRSNDRQHSREPVPQHARANQPPPHGEPPLRGGRPMDNDGGLPPRQNRNMGDHSGRDRDRRDRDHHPPPPHHPPGGGFQKNIPDRSPDRPFHHSEKPNIPPNEGRRAGGDMGNFDPPRRGSGGPPDRRDRMSRDYREAPDNRRDRDEGHHPAGRGRDSRPEHQGGRGAPRRSGDGPPARADDRRGRGGNEHHRDEWRGDRGGGAGRRRGDPGQRRR